jgi:hypothetical protein
MTSDFEWAIVGEPVLGAAPAGAEASAPVSNGKAAPEPDAAATLA